MTINENIERQLLGKLLLDHRIYEQYRDLWDSVEFDLNLHSSILKAILKQIQTLTRVNQIALADEVKSLFNSKGEAIIFIQNLKKGIQNLEPTNQQLELLITAKTYQKLNVGVMELSDMVTAQNDVDDIKKKALSIFEGLTSSAKGEFKPILSHITDVYDVIHTNRSGVVNKGLKTGFTKVDQHTNGWQGSDLVIIAAETSMGKTCLALSFAINTTKLNQVPVGIFSYEMSAVQLTARLCAMESDLSSKLILYRSMSDGELKQFDQKIKPLCEAPIFIDEALNNSVNYLVKRIRQMYHSLGVRDFYIDYLQLLKAEGYKNNREQELAYISRSLKNVAKELDVNVKLLCQLSRDEKGSGVKPPTIRRLRGSGEIEESADIIILLHRPEYYLKDQTPSELVGIAELDFAKGRNIGTGVIQLGFNGELTKFIDPETMQGKSELNQTKYNKIEPNDKF
jgi:replicative DNA helicase